ncbi:MAG: ferritin-like domain-containing protein [Lachnospiraceae bacterium]|nr:ferritin-like domain-containing protein [Lachnospiraceae bacterium]
MGTLSEKELSLLNDALTEEQLLVSKYQMLAQQSQEPEISSKFEQISQRHQKHFNELYSLLG